MLDRKVFMSSWMPTQDTRVVGKREKTIPRAEKGGKMLNPVGLLETTTLQFWKPNRRRSCTMRYAWWEKNLRKKTNTVTSGHQL